MKTTEAIAGLIAEYREIPPDYTGINELVEVRTRLSIMCFELAQEMAESRKKWKVYEFQYKSNLNKKKAQLCDALTMQRAEMKSREMLSKLGERAMKWEVDYQSKQLVFSAAKEVMAALGQRVSYVKEDYKETKIYQKTELAL